MCGVHVITRGKLQHNNIFFFSRLYSMTGYLALLRCRNCRITSVIRNTTTSYICLNSAMFSFSISFSTELHPFTKLLMCCFTLTFCEALHWRRHSKQNSKLQDTIYQPLCFSAKNKKDTQYSHL